VYIYRGNPARRSRAGSATNKSSPRESNCCAWISRAISWSTSLGELSKKLIGRCLPSRQIPFGLILSVWRTDRNASWDQDVFRILLVIIEYASNPISDRATGVDGRGNKVIVLLRSGNNDRGQWYSNRRGSRRSVLRKLY